MRRLAAFWTVCLVLLGALGGGVAAGPGSSGASLSLIVSPVLHNSAGTSTSAYPLYALGSVWLAWGRVRVGTGLVTYLGRLDDPAGWTVDLTGALASPRIQCEWSIFETDDLRLDLAALAGFRLGAATLGGATEDRLDRWALSLLAHRMVPLGFGIELRLTAEYTLWGQRVWRRQGCGPWVLVWRDPYRIARFSVQTRISYAELAASLRARWDGTRSPQAAAP